MKLFQSKLSGSTQLQTDASQNKLPQTKPMAGFIALMLLSLAVSYRIDESFNWLSFSFQIIDFTAQISASVSDGLNSEIVKVLVDLNFDQALHIIVMF